MINVDPDFGPREASPGETSGIWISASAAAAILLALAAAALALRFAGSGDPWTAAGKVVTAALVVGVVPGACATLLWRPTASLTGLEVLGYGLAVSFGLVHLLTVAALVLHSSAGLMAGALVLVSAAAAVWLIVRRAAAPRIAIRADEGLVALLMLALSVFLYVQGSPVELFEDQVHVAIARRLAALTAPTVDALYFAPGVLYTYPAPSIHYFLSLVTTLGDIDALFVYHKMRFFWGPAAIVMLHLAARAVFGTRAIACAVAVTAVTLAAAGVFAAVPTFFWAQLVPYSHASDVAMNVLMPALLAMTFCSFHAHASRERALFVASALLLVFMLTVVHIREVVQFAMYLACFLLLIGAVRSYRPYARHALVLLASTAAIAVVYVSWQRATFGLVTAIVGQQRDRLVDDVRSASMGELLFRPASDVLGSFVQGLGPLFDGVTPFVLFAGPVIVLLFRRRPLVWLVSSSVLVYVVVMSVPLAAFAYIYTTYYEILFTPVRNIIFFVYLLAGALAYIIVVGLARVGWWRLAAALSAGAALGLLALLAAKYLNRSHWGFFVPLLAAYAITLLHFDGSGSGRRPARLRVAIAFAAACFALVALFPEQSPPVEPPPSVHVRWADGLEQDARVALEQRFSLERGERLPDPSAHLWAYDLPDTSEANVRALVQHPDVVDTHHIDRSTFIVEREPLVLDDPTLGETYVPWLRYPGRAVLVATAALIGLLGLLLPTVAVRSSWWNAWVETIEDGTRGPFTRHAVALILFLLAFAAWNVRPLRSPLALVPAPPFGIASTPDALVSQAPCVPRANVPAPFSEDIVGEPLLLPDVISCAPSLAVIRWIQANVPAEAVLAINRWNEYLPSVFVPQQVVAYPGLERSFANEQELFSGYYRFYRDRLRDYREQPFFNAVETPSERMRFLRDLGITHVLVDPASYGQMGATLGQLSTVLERRYADGEWAVYEVIRSSLQ